MKKFSINRHYVIFSGFFHYEQKICNSKKIKILNQYYKPRFSRYEARFAIDFFNKHVCDYFYRSFNNIAFPESKLDLRECYIKKDNLEFKENIPIEKYFRLNKKGPKHLTLKITEHLKSLSILYRDKKIKFGIEYVDLYMYPEGIGIFTIKTGICNSKVNIDDLIGFINQFRLQEKGEVEFDGKNSIKVKEFVEKYILLNPYNLEFFHTKAILDFNHKLKSFIMLESNIDSNKSKDSQVEDRILFRLGTINVSELDTRILPVDPTNDYYENTLKENKISIFEDWTALSLFDTFTVILKKKQKNTSIYEYAEWLYHPIFLHNLYLKLSLYRMNSDIIKDRMLTKKNSKRRDHFIEIRNNYDFSHISFNFLPNLIYKKIRSSLGIDNEIEFMENKVEKLNTFIQEKINLRTNRLLILLSIIAMVASFRDISAWLQKLFRIQDSSYHFLSGGLVSLIILIIIIFILFHKKK